MAANKKCVMNVFLMDKTTKLFGTKWLFRIFLTYISVNC